MDFQNLGTKILVFKKAISKKYKSQKKGKKLPKFDSKYNSKIQNFEILVNFDPFIIYQNFYNIFFSKIGALPKIMISSFWKYLENSGHSDFLIF